MSRARSERYGLSGLRARLGSPGCVAKLGGTLLQSGGLWGDAECVGGGGVDARAARRRRVRRGAGCVSLQHASTIATSYVVQTATTAGACWRLTSALSGAVTDDPGWSRAAPPAGRGERGGDWRGRTLMAGSVACSLEAKETLCVDAPKQYIRRCRDETRVRVAAACHAPPLLPSCCQGPMASSSTGTLSQ